MKISEVVKLDEAVRRRELPIYYFAYGMLTDPQYMKDVGARMVGRAVLQGYGLEMYLHANVHPEAGDRVIGTLWQINRGMLADLDRTEGYPDYYIRKEVPVYSDATDRQYRATVYVMTKDSREHSQGRQPSPRYIEMIARGYHHAGIPLSQLEHAITANKAQAKSQQSQHDDPESEWLE
jgi:gamma-glutamylcyclotransferase (GGCT)/AIG2-like uncharacterized protein YtfP